MANKILTSESERIVMRSDSAEGPCSPRSVSMRIRRPDLDILTDLDVTCGGSSSRSSSPTRASKLKSQFIEVYLGTKAFAEADDLKVVISINLQASERLYEVIIVNKDSARELNRLYVHESELSEQMDARHAALTNLLCNTDPNYSTGTPGFWSKQRRASLQNSSPSTTKNRKASLPAISAGQDIALRLKEYKRLKIAELNRDEELQKMIHFDAKNSPLGPPPRRVAQPVVYFGLMAGSSYPPLTEFKKLGNEAMLKDRVLFYADICSSTVKGIEFYTAVILHSLYVRRTVVVDDSSSQQLQFVLFDGESVVKLIG